MTRILNVAQADVLEHVSRGDTWTSNVTAGSTVSGTAATALQRKGLVKIAVTRSGRKVTLTREGRKTLNRIRRTKNGRLDG